VADNVFGGNDDATGLAISFLLGPVLLCSLWLAPIFLRDFALRLGIANVIPERAAGFFNNKAWIRGSFFLKSLKSGRCCP